MASSLVILMINCFLSGLSSRIELLLMCEVRCLRSERDLGNCLLLISLKVNPIGHRVLC
jgi:hypothetical protein